MPRGLKLLSVSKYLLALIGFSLLVEAYFDYKSKSSFLSEAIKTEGKVVDHVKAQSGNSDNSYTYRPVVHFMNQNGHIIKFVSPLGSNPPNYSIGEKVEIFYHPTEPQNAMINSFISIWGGSVIRGGMGVLVFVIGSYIIIVGISKNLKNDFLKKNGIPIKTELQSIQENPEFSINGKHPFIIVTQWMNPSTGKLHIFKSDNLWLDPSDHVKNKFITVLIEKDNPRKYLVDLSFLPKLDNRNSAGE